MKEQDYLKTKKLFKILQTCRSMTTCSLEIVLHVNAKVWIFADRFCSHFNARGFTNRSKSWIQLRSNNVHCHFCFLSPKSCFKSVTVVKTYLEAISAPDLHVFAAVVGWKPSQKGLCTHWTSILRPPKHCLFPFYFKARGSDLSLLGVKTRPWKILDLARKCTSYLREKTCRRPTIN